MPCEMCGREAPLRRATVEGTLMNVCGNCVKFGVEVAGHAAEVTGRSKVVESLQRREARGRPRDVYDQMSEELVPDYSAIVRNARLKKGFQTTEELGLRINEKKAVLDKVESGTLHPADELVKKLERELGIKLMEKPEANVAGPKQGAGGPVTLGDLIKQQMDSRKK